jgi:hypothetical protein
MLQRSLLSVSASNTALFGPIANACTDYPWFAQARLDAMFRSRKLRASDLDARCYSTLNELPVATAIAVLERFSAKVQLGIALICR